MKNFRRRTPEAARLHRYHARRRAIKKTALLLVVLGALCLVISGLLGGIGALMSGSAKPKLLTLAAVYSLIGASMLLVRGLLAIIQNLLSRRVQAPPPEEQPRKQEQARALAETRSGMVLVLMLVMLALIAGIVVEAQMAARLRLRAGEAELARTRLRIAATDAVFEALRVLADDEDLDVDHPGETWALPRESVDPEGIATRTRVIDSARFFDLNNLAGLAAEQHSVRPTSDMVMDIMTLCGDFAPVSKVDALIDWIDDNDEGFAEKHLYSEKDPPFEPANRQLQSWGELLSVDGFTREMFEPHERYSVADVFKANMIECFTVLPRNGTAPQPININSASREVLLGILGMDREPLVAMILSWRKDKPLRSVDPVLAALEPGLAEAAVRYLDVKSNCFEIEAAAYADGRTCNLRALASRAADGEMSVLQWVY